MTDQSTARRSIRVRLLSNGSAGQTTARLFAALAEALEARGHVVDFGLRQLPRGKWPKLKALPRIEAANARRVRASDVLVIHSPLALSFFSVLLARLLGRKVVVYEWDLHPESTLIVGTLRNPLLIKAYSLLEWAVLRLSTVVVIPSKDYAPHLRKWRSKLRVIPLWPCDPVVEPASSRPNHSGVLRVAFAGQINSIRGIAGGAQDLLRAWGGDLVEIHIFSADGCPSDLLELAEAESQLRVIERGQLEPDALQLSLQELDAGWVSLDPAFGLPAYPSKALAYVCAGLPVLYGGPPLPDYRAWLVGSGLGLCVDTSTIDPDQLAAVRRDFSRSRNAYFESMIERWYGIEDLL